MTVEVSSTETLDAILQKDGKGLLIEPWEDLRTTKHTTNGSKQPNSTPSSSHPIDTCIDINALSHQPTS